MPMLLHESGAKEYILQVRRFQCVLCFFIISVCHDINAFVLIRVMDSIGHECVSQFGYYTEVLIKLLYVIKAKTLENRE